MITCGGRSSESDFQGAAAPTSGTLDPHGGARRATPLSVWHYGPTLLDTAARSSTCLRFRHAARSPAQCPALANVCGTNEIVDGFLSVSRPFNHRTRVRMVGLCAALAVALSLGLVPLSSADTAGDKKKLDANIAALRIALEGTSKDLAKAFLELQRTKALLPRARQELTAADAAQSVADRHNQTMAAALAVAEANAAKATDALVQNARDSQDAHDQLGNLVRDDYQQGGVSGLSIALEATSPQDLTNRIIMMDTVMRVRRATLRGLDTMRAQGEAAQAYLVAVRRQVAALKVQAQAALATATAARKTAAAAKAELDLLYAAQTRYEAAVAAKKAAEIANLKKMQAQSDLLM